MASAKEFVQSPSMEVLETFKKDMLMQIAQELQLEVKRSTHKHELKRLIVEQLVDEDDQQRKEELEAQQRKEELEAQQRKEELEAQQRKEELEAQKEERALKHEREMRELPMKSPLLPNLIWVKMCDWYHLLMSRRSISTFNTLKEYLKI